MEENTSRMGEDYSNREQTSEAIVCERCGSMDIEQGHVLPLCSNCRTELAKRPIPVWLKGAFVIVAVLVLIALGRFPKSLKGGIEYERALRAERENKQATALKHYQNAVAIYPDSTLALARLYISYYNNEKILEAAKTFDSIAGRQEKNEWLVNDVNMTTERMLALYLPNEEFTGILEANKDKSTEEITAVFKDYNKKNPDNVFVAYNYSNILFNMEKYDEAEEIMTKIMVSNKDFYSGYLLLAAICRETGRVDKGIEYCNEVIKNNVESAAAFSAMARLELKRHNDKVGLELAKKAQELDESETYSLATLAMAYHYNNLIEDRDKTFEDFKMKVQDDEYNIQLLTNIFTGKLSWRD